MTADWDAVLAEGERLLRAWAGNQPVEREWRLWVDANMPALLSAALREQESAKEVERLREALRKVAIASADAPWRNEAWGCELCGKTWWAEQGEQHAHGCLAALAAEKGEQT